MVSKKKWLVLTLVVSMLITTLIGCNKSASQNDGNTKVEVMDNDSVQSDSKNQDVSLTLWGTEQDEELLQKMIDSFIEKYKSEANISITFMPVDESLAKDTMLADINNAPDVFAFADDQLMTLVSAGVLEKITDDGTVKASNTQASVEAASIDGELYAYPMTADNGYFLYYNKEYFKEQDLETLDQILAIAQQNNKKVTMDWTSGWYLYSFFGNTGMNMYLNDDGVTNYCDWNSVDGDIKGIDVANAMLAIAKNPGFLNGGDDAFVAGIKDGSVIAGVSGVWQAENVKEVWGDNYGAVKLPTYTCNGKQVQMASYTGFKLVGVNSYTENREWSEKLANWLTNEANQTLRFVERGLGPSNLNAAESKEVKQSPAITAVIAQSEYGVLQRVGGNYWDPMAEFGKNMALGNPDNKDLQKVMDELVTKITALIGS